MAAETGRELGGFAVESENRTAGGEIGDLEITPTDSVVPAGADRLHAGFFSGEAGSVAFKAIGFSLAVGNFGRGVNTIEEAVAEAENGGFDAADFGEISSDADNCCVGGGKFHKQKSGRL